VVMRVCLLGLYALVAFWGALLMSEQQLVDALPYDWRKPATLEAIWLVNVGLILLCFLLSFADSVRRSLQAMMDGAGAAFHTEEEPSKKYDVFISHDWSPDSSGRPNHERVSQLNAALQAVGVRTWFDTDRMNGDIVESMTSGIDGSSLILICITPAYISKVAGKGVRGVNDNCKLEFDYAANRLGIERMLPVLMDPTATDISKWFGAVGARLGQKLYLDLSFDFDSATVQSMPAFHQLRRQLKTGRGPRRSTCHRRISSTGGVLSKAFKSFKLTSNRDLHTRKDDGEQPPSFAAEAATGDEPPREKSNRRVVMAV